MERLINRNVKENQWGGFRLPTVLIESQSDPVLAGDPIEQRYMRAFVLAGPNDLVVTDFSLDVTYVKDYLAGMLKFDLPEFLVLSNSGGETLSDNLLASEESLDLIKKWVGENGHKHKVQFFNISRSEIGVLDKLGCEATCGNIQTTMEMGTKTGFRRFCDELGLPMAPGFICNDLNSTVEAIDQLMIGGAENGVLIKAMRGTGGNSLMSNLLISADEYLQKTGIDPWRFVEEKLSWFKNYLGSEWVVEKVIEGREGSVHAYIHDQKFAEKAFVLGALSEDNSYVGGYYPFVIGAEDSKMIGLVDNVIVPELQALGIYGYHCFDFMNGCFLEDNARPGALDFIHEFVARVVKKHFTGEQYAYWHCHIPLPKSMEFGKIFSGLGGYLDPENINANNGCLTMITNQEVTICGRDLDLTVVSVGKDASVEKSKAFFEYIRDMVGRL